MSPEKTAVKARKWVSEQLRCDIGDASFAELVELAKWDGIELSRHLDLANEPELGKKLRDQENEFVSVYLAVYKIIRLEAERRDRTYRKPEKG